MGENATFFQPSTQQKSLEIMGQKLKYVGRDSDSFYLRANEMVIPEGTRAQGNAKSGSYSGIWMQVLKWLRARLWLLWCTIALGLSLFPIK